MPRTSRKTRTVLIALTLVLVGAGVAFAFWTSGGSGSGSGTTAAGTDPLVVNQTSVVTSMGPGVAAQGLSGDFDNPNTVATFVTSVTASISAVSGGDGACSAADYTLSGAVMDVSAQIPAGAGVGSWSGATIAFNNDPAVNQDGCKNATVSLAYVAS